MGMNLRKGIPVKPKLPKMPDWVQRSEIKLV